MKYIILFILLGAAVGNCTRSKTHSTAVSSISVVAVADITDKKSLWPESQPIVGLYDFRRNREAAYRFSLSVISEKKVNPTYSAFLPDGNTTEAENTRDDVQFREKRIIRFARHVNTIIDSFYRHYDTASTQQYSECWSTVCSVLETLAAQQSEKRYLLLYSDLLENSLFSAYKLTATASVGTIAKLLHQIHPAPIHLSGITVIVLYNPMTRADDIRFAAMYGAYKQLLEQNGAVVTLQSGNGAITV